MNKRCRRRSPKRSRRRSPKRSRRRSAKNKSKRKYRKTSGSDLIIDPRCLFVYDDNTFYFKSDNGDCYKIYEDKNNNTTNIEKMDKEEMATELRNLVEKDGKVKEAEKTDISKFKELIAKGCKTIFSEYQHCKLNTCDYDKEKLKFCTREYKKSCNTSRSKPAKKQKGMCNAYNKVEKKSNKTGLESLTESSPTSWSSALGKIISRKPSSKTGKNPPPPANTEKRAPSSPPAKTARNNYYKERRGRNAAKAAAAARQEEVRLEAEAVAEAEAAKVTEGGMGDAIANLAAIENGAKAKAEHEAYLAQVYKEAQERAANIKANAEAEAKAAKKLRAGAARAKEEAEEAQERAKEAGD
jgi:hypothetical protein